MPLTKATYSMISGATVNAFDFMTPAMIADVQARTATVDTTTSIQAAINSLGAGGGVVRLPKGRYLTTAKITLPTGVSLIGDGQFGGVGTYDQGATTILGRHNGTAVLSLVGSVSCTVSDLALMSDGPANPWPQTGLLLGRNTSASAGYHKVLRVAVYGNFTVANVYSIASEDNYWEDLNCWNYALGGAKNVFYTSIGNSNPAMTEPLVTSSNLDNVFVRFWLTSNEPAADASCIYLDNAEGMGSFSFFGGYCTAAEALTSPSTTVRLTRCRRLARLLLLGLTGSDKQVATRCTVLSYLAQMLNFAACALQTAGWIFWRGQITTKFTKPQL